MKKLLFIIIACILVAFSIIFFFKHKESKLLEQSLFELTTYNPEYVNEDFLNSIHVSLLENNELIPFGGSLGGTPNFYSKDNIFLLEDNVVIAYWEDGHTNGFVILKYKLTKEEEFEWRNLYSYISS